MLLSKYDVAEIKACQANGHRGYQQVYVGGERLGSGFMDYFECVKCGTRLPYLRELPLEKRLNDFGGNSDFAPPTQEDKKLV